jgi:phosphate transport system permease protein
VVGFQDGSLRTGKINVLARVLEGSDIPPALSALPNNSFQAHENGIAHRNTAGTLRHYQLKAEFDEPIKAPAPGAIALVDLTIRPNGPVIGSLAADGTLRISETTTRENYLTGETVRELNGGSIKIPPRGQLGLPTHVLVNGVADSVYLAWKDGHLLRVNTANINKPLIAEEMSLVEAPAKLTALQFMIGKATLISGDSTGRVRAWFRTPAPDAKLVNAHELPVGTAAVSSFAVSSRSRVMAAAYADGTIGMFYLTNQKDLAHLQVRGGNAVDALAISPKEDGLLAISGNNLFTWSVNVGYPEVSFRALICPIWYEGYPASAHVWQTSSADDAFEPKYGMWPLIFGTLKATFYSLLIGVPLALMAAVYTREFLHPRLRGVVKPTIEVMASLPSVVLGFLAALVIAPFVENVVPAILTAIVVVPTAFVFGGFAWHLLPIKLQRQLQGRRFLLLLLVFPISLILSVYLAPVVETWLFQGNVKTWLATRTSPGTSGWFILILPLAAVTTTVLIAQFVNPILRRWAHHQTSMREGWANFAKFLVGAALTVGSAWLLALVLTSIGFDPRDSFMGTYVQRNAMIVGFMMGFAIIPIIYTIADDALAAVPDHLRSASLGCGATNWQTASRIIIPTAMSGLFSAVMVGLGRAVGETMVVLMAAGNTPVLDLNIFNGFRTLSANIAVELPEAVKDSTHYRTLFLAALVLFAMTFILNSLAEAMRQRFRRRAFEL